MTNKEQIIVDGVNIIDCNNYYIEQETDQVKCDLFGEYCRENKNCFHKQLARKTQECEELKKQDYENLKIIHSNFNQIKSLRAENTHYLKALEEIEEICKNGVYDEFNMPLDECDFILDIINKAKGE